MMTGRRSVSRAGADAAAELDAGEAGQHPVEQHEVGHLLAQADLGLVAAGDAVDLVALGLEIVAQEQRQRLLVLDDQNAQVAIAQAPVSPRRCRSSSGRSSAGRSARVSPVTR